MKRRSSLVFLLLVVFVFSMFTGSLNLQEVYADEDENSEQLSDEQDVANTEVNIDADNDKLSEKVKEKIADAHGKLDMSPIHKQNVTKILFSNKPIVPGSETANQFKTDFTANENIYAIAYLPLGLQDITDPDSLPEEKGFYPSRISIIGSADYYVDDSESQLEIPVSIPVNALDYEANKGYVIMELIPNPSNTIGYDSLDWYNKLSNLEAGEHEIFIMLMFDDEIYAGGGFTIDWSGADLKKLEQNADTCMKIATDNRANQTKLPKEFSAKHVKYQDSILSDENIQKLYMNKNTNAAKILKFVNYMEDGQTDWIIFKDDYGIPTKRESSGWTWILYQGKDGWCYFSVIGVGSTYTGGGTYGQPWIFERISPVKISLANAGVTNTQKAPVEQKVPAVKTDKKEIKVSINGEILSFDVPPVSQNGRTLVPLRAIFEALGMTVEWDASAKTATGKNNSTTVILKEGSKTASVNGQESSLDVPVASVNGRIMVPVRFIAESTGCSVNWDATTNTVVIVSK